MRIEFSARGHKRTDGTFEIVGGIDLDVEEIATLLVEIEKQKIRLKRQAMLEEEDDEYC